MGLYCHTVALPVYIFVHGGPSEYEKLRLSVENNDRESDRF
jgi:hypothetical protein